MKGKKSGYNRYKVIFENIKALCHVLGEPEEVIKGPLEGIAEESCEEDCEHYIIGNGLHVYIRDEYIYISENDVQYWGDERGRKGEELGQFYLSYNKESIECICHADNGRPYTLVQYFNHELDETVVHGEAEEAYGRIGKDNAFIPNSFENWNETSEGSGNVPADIGEAISLRLDKNTQTGVRAVCNRIIALNEKIKEYAIMIDRQEFLQNEIELIELRSTLMELAFEILKIDKDNAGEIKSKVEEAKEIERKIADLEKKIQRIQGQIRQKLEEVEVDQGNSK